MHGKKYWKAKKYPAFMSSRIMDNICLLFCFIVFCNYVIFMTKILQFKEKTDLSEYTK